MSDSQNTIFVPKSTFFVDLIIQRNVPLKQNSFKFPSNTYKASFLEFFDEKIENIKMIKNDQKSQNHIFSKHHLVNDLTQLIN